MNTIKVFLAESGRIADLKKDFPLYQGQFQNKLLNIYVPTSILAPDFTSQAQDGTVTEFVASTGVKIGMTFLDRSGVIKKSKNYYMRYLKTLTYQNVEYALYERKLPKEFTTYAGQGENAPTLVANVVNIQLDTESGSPKILSIITSQECKLDVLPSALLDQDEAIEPTELEVLDSKVNETLEQLSKKQDKEDDRLETTDKTVVGAINENRESIEINKTTIQEAMAGVSSNRNEIDKIKEEYAMAEEYVGKLTGTVLPSSSRLNAFVNDTLRRPPKNGDVVIFILEIDGETDKNYKYIYSKSGWSGYEIPALETAQNGTLGIVKGTYGVADYNMLVDISGGQILSIWVKDDSGNYRDIREYANSLKTTIQNIISGDTAVGYAVKAVTDALGNNIVDTYLTQNAGATKKYVRDYALPREFNDIYFISANGYSKEIPTTPEDGVQFTTIVNAVGDFELFQIEKENTADFELSSKNSYRNNIFISTDVDTTANFRLITQYKKEGEDWQDLNVELTNTIGFTAGDITKVEFSSSMDYLGEKVVSLVVGDKIRQTLEVVTRDSKDVMFEVYSNSTYPSVFNLNTQSQTLIVQQGDLGQEPVYSADGTYNSDTNTITFELSDAFILNNNTEAYFSLSFATEIEPKPDTKLVLTYHGQEINLVTPYGLKNETATADQMEQVYHTFNSIDGAVWVFKGFIKEDGGEIYVLVDIDNLNQVKTYDLIIRNQDDLDRWIKRISATNDYDRDTEILIVGNFGFGEKYNLNIESQIISSYGFNITGINRPKIVLSTSISGSVLVSLKSISGVCLCFSDWGLNSIFDTRFIEDCVFVNNNANTFSFIPVRAVFVSNTTFENYFRVTLEKDTLYSSYDKKYFQGISNCLFVFIKNDNHSSHGPLINANGGIVTNCFFYSNATSTFITNANAISNVVIRDKWNDNDGRVNIIPTLITDSKNISNVDISYSTNVGGASIIAKGIANCENICNCIISLVGAVKSYGLYECLHISNCKNGAIPCSTSLIGGNCTYVDSETVENAESYSNIGKTLLLGADGVIESDRVVFTVQNAETYMPYRTNLRSFMTDFALPIVGALDPSLKVAVTFGDTTYNLYDIMRGTDEVLSVGDIMSVSKYSTETGFRFFPEIVFFETSAITGFTIMPTNITARQLENIIESNDSVVIDTNGTKLQIHLSNEILNKLQKVLVLPVTTSTSSRLVGVSSSGTQEMLELGTGLSITDGILSATGGGGDGGSAEVSVKSETLVVSTMYSRLTELCNNHKLLHLTIEAPFIYATTVTYQTIEENADGTLKFNSYESYDDVIVDRPTYLFGGFSNSPFGPEMEFASCGKLQIRLKFYSSYTSMSINGREYTQIITTGEGPIDSEIENGTFVLKAYYI